jgi:hypothetical protein
MGLRTWREECLKVRTLGGGRLVELHESPASLDCLSFQLRERMRVNAVPIIVGGVSVTALRPGDMLLHVCLHAGRRDQFTSGLVSLLDIALLVEAFGDEIDWRALRELARQEGIVEWVQFPLALATEFLGAAVPDEVLDGAGGDRWELIRELAERQLWSTPDRTVMVPGATYLFSQQPISRRLTQAARRLTKHYWDPPGSRPRSTLGGRILDGVRRFAADVPRWQRLVTAWRQGGLGRAGAEAGFRSARERAQLIALIEGRDPSHISADEVMDVFHR